VPNPGNVRAAVPVERALYRPIVRGKRVPRSCECIAWGTPCACVFQSDKKIGRTVGLVKLLGKIQICTFQKFPMHFTSLLTIALP